jgi:hypothetical protein
MSGLFGGGSNKGAEKQLAEQKKENERLRAEAEQERVNLAEDAAARRRARQRGGSRMLLSEARLAPETGVGQQTLGAGPTQ